MSNTVNVTWTRDDAQEVADILTTEIASTHNRLTTRVLDGDWETAAKYAQHAEHLVQLRVSINRALMNADREDT